MIKKRNFVFFVFVCSLFVFTACTTTTESDVALPSTDMILADVQRMSLDVLLGEAKEGTERFLFDTIVFEEAEIHTTKVDDEVTAEVTAWVGDEQWISEEKKKVIVNYKIDNTSEWKVLGWNAFDPVIPVLQRTENE